MQINVIEIINILFLLGSLLVLQRQRDTTTLLLILFFYATLHFSFAAILMTTFEPLYEPNFPHRNKLDILHIEGGGTLANLSALLIIVFSFVLLSIRGLNFWLSDKKVLLHFSVILIFIFVGYLANIIPGNWAQLKNVISVIAMVTLLFIGVAGLKNSPILNLKPFYAWWVFGFFILVFANCIAVYEILSNRAWAGAPNSHGAMVWRASSILFNPNLYAFWLSLVYLGCAYGMHEYATNRRVMLLGMILASIGIFLSGARSICILLLVVLFVSAMMLGKKNKRLRWIPFITLPLTFLFVYATARWFEAHDIANFPSLHSIVLLGERFAEAPRNLVSYFVRLMPFSTELDFLTVVAPEISSSIEGRFVDEGRDSGFMVLYDNVGWVGFAAILWFWGVLAAWGVRAHFIRHDATSVYALATLSYCFFTGLIMRFQIFPVWLFVGIALVPCLFFWRKVVQ